MKAIEREEAVRLRRVEKLGYGEIAKRLNVAKSTLSRWLEDLPLSDARILELRRQSWGKGEAKRERFRQTMRVKRDLKEQKLYEEVKSRLSRVTERDTYVAGLMLYAAEGDKKSRYEIAFSNTDVALVRFFSRWLTRYLGIDARSLKIQLHLYENMEIPAEESYWLKELGFGRRQLCKSQIKKVHKNGFKYQDVVRHGTCKLYIGGGAEKAELMLSIRAFFDTYSRQMRV